MADVPGEVRALRTGAAWLPSPTLSTWRVRGRQAGDFLHRVTTQDVRSLAPGRARRACVLTVQGRCLGDPVVWNLGDSFWLTMEGGAAEKAVPALDRYVIADDVAFEDESRRWVHARLAGPRSPDVLAAAGIGAPEPGAFAPVDGGRVLRRDLGRLPAFHAVAPAGPEPGWMARLRDARGVVALSEGAWDAARVVEGVAAWGAEVDERILPNEAGLEDAVSFTKGCYPGQEPVVMARHRGHPPTLLCRLRVETSVVPPRDAALLAGEARAGRLSTCVRDPDGPGVLALGFVRYDLAEAGRALRVETPPASAVVDAVLAHR